MTVSNEQNKAIHNTFINEEIDLEEIKQKYEITKNKIEVTKEKRQRKKGSKLTENPEGKRKDTGTSMKNITINIPNIYDEKIQWLIDNKFLVSRSEAIRTAVREFLQKEYNGNLDLLGYFKFIQKTEKEEK